ncbi:beta-lactamase class A [Nocardiopsis arvandica]|uniref:Beta-lactamase class A n=1 Tax=Nocardiopsis sinuspersici TaxID=501010 RepID=A0A7Z0BJN1_9ACTN|nr:beta-lactamase class A [Nocardiopsis sinuspersici]
MISVPRRRPPAETRTWSALTTAVVLVALMALALPGATSAAGSVPPEPDPALVRALLSEEIPPLVPFAPRTGPATGGQGLTPAQREELTARIGALSDEYDADFGVAVQDLRTGATFSHNAHQQFPTASTVKLTILAMLLLRAQEEGRDLTEAERAQVSVMIRYSDNEVTDGLYSRIGFTDGFVHGSEVLGFTDTDPHPRGVWGATMTTAADQVRLLRALYCEESPLSQESRDYARGLMESVAPEQAWGVSAGADPDDVVGLKNGWTPRESNGGLWNVNSVGYVAGSGHEYLIAVLTDGSAGYAMGVALVEELASTVTGALEEPLTLEESVR